jgi:GT2 family glycosyltransferase
MSEPPRFSVVVPTCGRPRLLRRCLRALAAQTLPQDRYEVIVVVDAPATAPAFRQARRLVEAVRRRHPGLAVRCLPNDRGKGPAGARNCGWRAAREALIAFTDDDTIPSPDWLSTAAGSWSQLRSRGLTLALAGRIEVPVVDEPPTDHELMTRGLSSSEFVTANAIVRRQALEEVGGFDERFGRPWREDSDLQFRLERCGRIARTPALVLHPVRAERWGVALRQQRNVFYDALLYKKHRHAYRQRIRRRPPWNYYLIVGCTLFALAASPAPSLRLPALTAAAVAIAGVMQLAWRRLRRTSRRLSHVVEMLATSALIPFLSVYWRIRGAWRFRVAFF